VDPFVVLLAFALVKIAIGLTLIWLGFRGGESGPRDDGFFEPAPDWKPPRLPPARRAPRPRRRTVAVARSRPVRSSPRTARRRDRV
jgi:hypothetical protein